jgi:hypothetical protein
LCLRIARFDIVKDSVGNLVRIGFCRSRTALNQQDAFYFALKTVQARIIHR